MLLAIDIGNTETTLALFEGDTPFVHWRITTSTPRTSDELKMLLVQLVQSRGLTHTDVDGVAVCSVVPPVTPHMVNACAESFQTSVVVVDSLSPLPVVLDVEEPATVGADRVANTLAASQIYRRDAIVVDLGTATTYDCVTADGRFFGGAIQPGVRSSADMLFRKTSMLPATALSAPDRAIGRNTVENIRAGVTFGAADAIDGMIRRMRAEWPGGGAPYVIATGGLAATFATLCTELDEVDPMLTLRGLLLAHRLLRQQPTPQPSL